jgi:hypothetical protein
MTAEEIFLEGEDRTRRLFGEVHFFLMRKMRYGIGNCTYCEDADLLRAQVEVLDWRRQKEVDDALGGGDDESGS